MTRTKLFLAGALALLVSFAATPATAQTPINQLTYFTFSAPFELPGGKVLPAGKYTFKILDSASNRHVVQIMGEDQQTLHAIILAIPAERMEPSEEPEIRFMEAAAEAPPAVRTWFYPGRVIGHEFVYPREQARRLAATQREGVLTVASDSENPEEMKSAELARVDQSGQETAVTEETRTAEATQAEAMPATETPAVTAEQTGTPAERTETMVEQRAPTAAPAAEPQTSAPAPTPAPETTAPAPRTAEPAAADRNDAQMNQVRTELPRTASPLPFIGLIGLGSLVGAGLLRARR